MLDLDGQVHHDTHAVPMGNYVIEVGNYVIATPSELGNYKIADMHAGGRRHGASRRAAEPLPMAGPDDRSHNRHRERLARPARAVPRPGSTKRRRGASQRGRGASGRTSSAIWSGPEHDTCGRYSGYSEDTTADNVSSPGPRTRRGYSKDSQNGARDNGGSVRVLRDLLYHPA